MSISMKKKKSQYLSAAEIKTNFMERINKIARDAHWQLDMYKWMSEAFYIWQPRKSNSSVRKDFGDFSGYKHIL